jgi:hypothetical protein
MMDHIIHEKGLGVQANPEQGMGHQGQMTRRDAHAQGLADCQA